ncbi:Protein MGR2 [Cyphellophora attinorum]|uniref:Protein MGR2 n=1 Tax=Cyphellophora attinorum TaxID=1664694 RepID=A0A0N1P187_9EURO|nr:Protein MGR2 [Phialophora attinorum]KPI44007.1 Protein MGR2 [Phialophora attinorum]
MPPMPASAQQHRGPHWFDKMKMGALMGTTVGGIMGFIYGTVTIFQYGAGQAGVMRTLGKFMVGSGAMFGLFMGIGSIIRNESAPVAFPMRSEILARTHMRPIIHPRRPPQSSSR